METFLIIYFLIFPISLYLIFFIHKRSSGDPKNLPPGSEGWPILGETFELATLGSPQLVRDRMQKYSPQVFKTSLMREKLAAFCGAQGNKFVFTNDNKLFGRWPPISLRKALYPTLAEVRHDEPLTTFEYDFLKPDALKRYVPLMDAMAREHLRDRWSPNSAVTVLPLMRKHALELVCAVFMNVVDSKRVGKLLEPLSLLTNGMIALPINLPGTAFNRALRGGRVVRAELKRIVEERRKEMSSTGNNASEGPNLLSKMVGLTDDDKVVNLIAGLLVSAQYVISSAITIIIYFLAQLPHIYNEVLKEQMEIANSKSKDEALVWEDVEKMKYTWNVVRECFRLASPSIGGFREAATEFTYAGFTIPKGWKALWTPHSSHMNPEYFPEPEKFDPSRFEGSGPAPYTYVPFGGGPRMCPGRGYVKLVMLVFIHNLVTTFGFEKVIPNEKMLFDRPSPAPAHGLPLHLHPH